MRLRECEPAQPIQAAAKLRTSPVKLKRNGPTASVRWSVSCYRLRGLSFVKPTAARIRTLIW